MADLVEKISTTEPALMTEWFKDGTPKGVIEEDMRKGANILARLRQVLDSKFQSECSKEYSPDASDRALGMSQGYKKALKEIYRLVQLDI